MMKNKQRDSSRLCAKLYQVPRAFQIAHVRPSNTFRRRAEIEKETSSSRILSNAGTEMRRCRMTEIQLTMTNVRKEVVGMRERERERVGLTCV